MMPNIRISAALNQATETLKKAMIANPHQEARWLLATHLDCDLADLWLNDKDVGDTALFLQRLEQRAQHQPLARIFGRKHFWRAEFHISPAVLDPRPDSEWLIETALNLCPTQPNRILDLGTGSGCLLLSALMEFPSAQGIGVDISQDALKIAQQNAEKLELSHRVTWQCNSWLDNWQGQACDLILTNPPYIPLNAALPKAVQDFDPHLALFAQNNGLAAYRAILSNITTVLKPSSLIIAECAPNQTEAIATMAMEYNLRTFSPLQSDSNVSLHPAAQLGLICLAPMDKSVYKQ